MKWKLLREIRKSAFFSKSKRKKQIIGKHKRLNREVIISRPQVSEMTLPLWNLSSNAFYSIYKKEVGSKPYNTVKKLGMGTLESLSTFRSW